MADQKICVLFVCLGNICRSPMAEAVFAHTVKLKDKSHLFRIDSAGTGNWHIGEPPDPRSVKTCKNHNVPVNGFARQITQEDFHEFDYILCMDESNLADLKAIKPKGAKAIVKLFGEYDPEGEKYTQ
ncbi:4356_t:CDS:2, partial [Ambispora leptoticha]